MKLSVLERLALLNVLPKEGNVTTLRIVRKLREDLSFSEEEHKELDFKQDGDRTTWNEGEWAKDIEIGEKATDVIVDAFRQLNRDGKMHIDFVDIYDRFIES